VLVKAGRSGNGKPADGRVAASRAGWVVAVLACAALAAACGSSPSSPSTPASPASSASPAAPASTGPAGSSPSAVPTRTGTAACAPSDLKVTQSTPNGYAGGVYVTIVFTNASHGFCSLYGYPGVSLVSASRQQIGLAAKRSSTVPVKLIILAPGTHADAAVQIVDALNFPSTTCNPVKAAYLKVYPPNQTVPVYLANTSEACAKPVQTLFVSAVQLGPGGSS